MNPEQDPELPLDKEALRLSKGNAALLYHHMALLKGKQRIRGNGEQNLEMYIRTTKLLQYPKVEQSVIEGWRKWVSRALEIPVEKQQDKEAVNYAMAITSLRRNLDGPKLLQVLRRHNSTFNYAASKGHVWFLTAVQRLLDSKRKGTALLKHDYSFRLLSHWLTDYYWLMPSKLVSALMAEGLGVSDNLKTLLATKSRYGLKSHKPTLVGCISKGKIELAKAGKIYLG